MDMRMATSCDCSISRECERERLGNLHESVASLGCDAVEADKDEMPPLPNASSCKNIEVLALWIMPVKEMVI
jgi:hypothetical protein